MPQPVAVLGLVQNYGSVVLSTRSFMLTAARYRLGRFFFLFLSLVSAITRADAQNWVQKVLPVNPSPRLAFTMAYDAARNETVLFGGIALNPDGSSRLLADTWIWNGTTWSLRAPASSPTPRVFASMVYDAARRQVVLFGGCPDPENSFCTGSETWTWDGVTWTQKSPPVSPSPRTIQAMVYDAAMQQVILHGGVDPTREEGFLADTWSWNGSTWVQREVAPGSLPRLAVSILGVGGVMAYDAVRQEVVLLTAKFSPLDGFDFNIVETWTFNGIAWNLKLSTSDRALAPSALGSMAYDEVRRQVVAFSAEASPANPDIVISSTWTWNGASWTRMIPAATDPTARFLAGMTYDAQRSQLVLFGGVAGESAFFNETWVLDSSPPATGTISVSTNLSSASFTITGPATYPGSGLSFTRNDAAPGTYTITYSAVLGYATPPSETKVLTAGGTIVFTGTYTPLPAVLVAPASLSFTYQQGFVGPISPQTVSVSSTGLPLSFSVTVTTNGGGNWLVVDRTIGTTPQTLGVGVSATLVSGTFTGQIRISAPGASNTPQTIAVNLTVTPPTPASTTLELVDPTALPGGILISPTSSTNQTTLANLTSITQGVSADGVTRVVIRFHTSIRCQVVFTLQNGVGQQVFNSPDNGFLTALDGTPLLHQDTVQVASYPNRNYVFALYAAPTRFVRPDFPSDSEAAERQVYLIATLIPTSGPVTRSPPVPVKIVRPPIMLVHGLWSDASVWDDFDSVLRSSLPCEDSGRFYACRIDYRDSHAAKFATSAPTVGWGIRDAIDRFKDRRKVAAFQADVIAHSMGGNVVRVLPLCGSVFADCNYDYRAKTRNLGFGDVHKLITIGTPHLGSPLANRLFQNRDTPCCRLFGRVCRGTLGEQLVAEAMRLDQGAVEDLQENAGAISGLNSIKSSFPIHFVVGVASGNDETLFSQGLVAEVRACSQSILPEQIRTVFGSDSDLVVSAHSQRLALPTGNVGTTTSVPTFGNTVHAAEFTRRAGGFSQPELSLMSLGTEVLRLVDNGTFIIP